MNQKAAEFENLGPQVTSQMVMRGVFGEENGRAVTYTVVAGTPAIFAAADVATGGLIYSAPLPATGGAWGLTVATDGRVYVATYNAANLHCYDPATRTITNLGDAAALAGLPKSTQYFELTAGARGCVYGGSYPNGHVFEYDPASGFRSFGQIFPGTQYPRCVAYDADEHALFVGGGGAFAWLVRVDLTTGAKSGNLLPADCAERYTYTYDMNQVGDLLILRMDPNHGLLILDKHSLAVLKEEGLLQSRGVSRVSPYEPKVYFTRDLTLHSLDLQTLAIEPVQVAGAPAEGDLPPGDRHGGLSPLHLGINIAGCDWVRDPAYPGLTLVAFLGNHGGRILKYHPPTGRAEESRLTLPQSNATLHTLALGPDSKIYCAAYLGGGMGVYDPRTGQTEVHRFSQCEGIASVGAKLYLGVYPGARLYEYDTREPWRTTGPEPTVVQRFELKSEHEQDRPYAMLGVEELGKLFIGTVPDYGKRGGALTVFEPSTGAYQVHRNIVDGHSIVSLAYHEGLLYGGTTYRGGLGAEDVVDDARLFAFDPATGAKLWEVVPFPGLHAITCLLVGPDQNLWGWAMGRLFIFDPKAREVIWSDLIFPDAVGLTRGGHMEISRADGQIYGTIAGRYFRIDPASRAVTVLRTEPSRRLAQDLDGNFYFVDGTTTDGENLWRHMKVSQSIEDR